MPQRSDIVAAAREWIDTPFVWQASVKGVGADCRGLISGVARDLGLPEADSFYARTADYAKVDPALLKAGLRAVFDPATVERPGDVLLLDIGGKPQHLAIYVGCGRMIHTYGNNLSRVIEVAMGRAWRDKIDSVWTWRGIA